MHPRTMSTLGVATAAAALTVTLTACGGAMPAPADDAAEATASRFVACLTTAGVDAKIGDQGHVLVEVASDAADGEISIGSGSGPSGASPLLMVGDSDGSTWVAAASSAYFADDPQTQDAYARCETELPGFVQPEVDAANDPALRDQLARQAEDGLAFARCGRDAGFAWVADPAAEPGTTPAIELPADLAEEEFRALLEACLTPDLTLAWMVPADLGFDWTAVLDEASGSGAASSHVESDDR